MDLVKTKVHERSKEERGDGEEVCGNLRVHAESHGEVKARCIR